MPLQEGTCATCGTVFAVNRARIDQARFCSRACRYASQRDPIPCTCKMCGKTVLRTPSHHAAVKTTYCSPACYMADPDRAARQVNMNGLQQQRYPNRLEQAGYALLDQLGSAYEPQYVIAGRFCVDAFVPTAKLAIQWDGDYWHGNPALFPEPDARQCRRRGLDKGQDAYLARCGYRVLRIWESELAPDPEAVARRIAEALAGE
jgi:very-short-patch-repair endonuclease